MLTTSFDLEQLSRKQRVGGQEFVLCRGGLSFAFYCDQQTHRMAESVAAALEAYLAFIPAETLKTYLARNGYPKPLTKAQLTKDLRFLGKFPPDYKTFHIRYSAGEAGQAGTHAFYFDSDLDAGSDGTFPLDTNLLRLEFPYQVIADGGLDRLLALVGQIAELIPFQSGNGGLAFQRAMSFPADTTNLVNQLLPRYLGFDPSFDLLNRYMRDHTPPAHWINFLNPPMLARCGGLEQLRAKLPAAELRPLRNGVLIRAAKLPPIGDRNRGASDLGLVPEVARLLRPTRVEISGLGQPAQIFDAMAWLARFDELPVGPWEAPAHD